MAKNPRKLHHVAKALGMTVGCGDTWLTKCHYACGL